MEVDNVLKELPESRNPEIPIIPISGSADIVVDAARKNLCPMEIEHENLGIEKNVLSSEGIDNEVNNTARKSQKRDIHEKAAKGSNLNLIHENFEKNLSGIYVLFSSNQYFFWF